MPHSLDSGACGLRDPQSAGSLTALRDFTETCGLVRQTQRLFALIGSISSEPKEAK